MPGVHIVWSVEKKTIFTLCPYCTSIKHQKLNNPRIFEEKKEKNDLVLNNRHLLLFLILKSNILKSTLILFCGCSRPPKSQFRAIFCHLNYHCVLFYGVGHFWNIFTWIYEKTLWILHEEPRYEIFWPMY